MGHWDTGTLALPNLPTGRVASRGGPESRGAPAAHPHSKVQLSIKVGLVGMVSTVCALSGARAQTMA